MPHARTIARSACEGPSSETIQRAIARRRARVAHQPAEDRAEEKEREVLRHEAAEARHEDLGVGGEQPRVAARDHGEQREERREDQDVDPAVRELHQQAEREENAEDANHRRRRMA